MLMPVSPLLSYTQRRELPILASEECGGGLNTDYTKARNGAGQTGPDRTNGLIRGTDWTEVNGRGAANAMTQLLRLSLFLYCRRL